MGSVTKASLGLVILALLSGFTWLHRPTRTTQVQTVIRHVVIVVQENRSFDNLFHNFPHADTRGYGYTHTGHRVQLHPVSLRASYDISNGTDDYVRSYDHGRMDGWDLRPTGTRHSNAFDFDPFPQYGYVPRVESAPYFELASTYVLADRMFQSNIDQSFAAHLYLIAGQAGRAANVPNARPWGCDSSKGALVRRLGDDRKIEDAVFPCFDFRTLGDELDAKRLTWRYYAPRVDPAVTWESFQRFRRHHPKARWKGAVPDFGQLWSSFDAIAHDRYGPQWSTNVVSPEHRVLADIASGDLANVTWIVPDWRNSDHSSSLSDTGPSWVASIVNTIGRSALWDSTAIVIVWDDSGGWYDHVPPPQVDYDGLGFRVPLIVVAPYAKRGYVSHVQYEFGSVLRFVEGLFDLEPLAASDRRANNLDDCFDFAAPARPFEAVGAPYSSAFFFRQRPSGVAPDRD